MGIKTQNFGKLPVEFCSIFAQSSVLIECVFPTFGNIWTKLGNQLGAEQAGKQVKI